MLYKLSNPALTGTLIALAVDLLMQAGLGIVRGDVRSIVLIGAMFDRLRWTVSVALIRAVAPSIDGRIAHMIPTLPELSTRAAWTLTGIVWLLFPIASELAMLLIMAARLTMAGTWSSGYYVFLEPGFYSDLIIAYAPWLLAGMTLLAWAKHHDERSRSRGMSQ